MTRKIVYEEPLPAAKYGFMSDCATCKVAMEGRCYMDKPKSNCKRYVTTPAHCSMWKHIEECKE